MKAPALDYSTHYFALNEEAHVPEVFARYDRILKPHLPADKAAPILDVGSGMGFAIAYAKSLGYERAEGVDNCETLQRYCVEHGRPVTLAPDAREFLRKKKGRYGAVLLLDVLEHVERSAQQELLLLIAQALRPGGVLIAQIPNASSLAAFHWLYSDFTHHTSFTEHAASMLLRSAGFSTVTLEAIEVPLRRELFAALKAFRPKRALKLFFKILVRKIWVRILALESDYPVYGSSILSLNMLAVGRRATASP